MLFYVCTRQTFPGLLPLQCFYVDVEVSVTPRQGGLRLIVLCVVVKAVTGVSDAEL